MSKAGVLVIGAAGAVGKRLVNSLAARGTHVVSADRLPALPEKLAKVSSAVETNVDVRDPEKLAEVMRRHPEVTTVWNLAAPLSVETAMDPKVAEEITMGGMRNCLSAMKATGKKRICFTDSIGSYGAEAPRHATARWLTENPTQDPGSDYGLQKRGCRSLLSEFQRDCGGDPRWAVLPGVLHSEAVWGDGTTEYALEALRAAARDEVYKCQIDPDVMLPMIYVDDLMRGLLAIQDVEQAKLREPEQGYCIPGLSFTANQLFDEIRKHKPEFQTTTGINPHMDMFAKLWPDSLNEAEPARDLGYTPSVGLAKVVDVVLAAHKDRFARYAKNFGEVDLDGNGTLERNELKSYLCNMVNPDRLDMSLAAGKTWDELCSEVVDRAMLDMDGNKDGRISFEEFEAWSRRNSFKQFMEAFCTEKRLGSSADIFRGM